MITTVQFRHDVWRLCVHEDVNKTGMEKIVFSLKGFKRNRHVRNSVDLLLNAKSSQLICILVIMGPKHCVMKSAGD